MSHRSKRFSKASSSTSHSRWSPWEWNETHKCESRYRLNPSGQGDYEYDYRPANQTPRFQPEIPVQESARIDENLYPVREGDYTHDTERRDPDIPSPTPAVSYTAVVNQITEGVAGLSTGSTHISTNNRQNERFDKSYKVHNQYDFKQFRVFKVLWSEPQGSTEGSHDTISVRDTRSGPVHEKVRRFVIISPIKGHCLCLPINTYLKQGTMKRGVHAEHHTIVHTSRKPQYLHGEWEKGMTRNPIRIDAATPRDKLAPESRLNYAKVYTVECNVKVCFLGKVHVDSRSLLVADYNALHPLLQYGGSTLAEPLPTDTVGQVGAWQHDYGTQHSQRTGSPERYIEQRFEDRPTHTISEGNEENMQNEPIQESTASEEQEHSAYPENLREEDQDDLYSAN